MMHLHRKLLDWLLGALGICIYLSPFAPLVLIVGYYFPWSRAMLSKHPWLIVVLVLVSLSRFVVAAWWSYQGRKYLDYLHSPEGQRRRAEEVQTIIAGIIADANGPELHSIRPPTGSPTFSAADVMTEARRLAKTIAEGKLKARGVRVPREVTAAEINQIARVLINADQSIIDTAEANLEKRSKR
jgi:hypothetical protein